MPGEVTLVKEIEVPTSGTSNPIVPGQMIAVYERGSRVAVKFGFILLSRLKQIIRSNLKLKLFRCQIMVSPLLLRKSLVNAIFF